MLGYLSADIIRSEKGTALPERKTVSYEEQVMSKDKYPSIFSPQIETIVFVILQIFFASFSWGIFGHLTRLGQSRASESI